MSDNDSVDLYENLPEEEQTSTTPSNNVSMIDDFCDYLDKAQEAFDAYAFFTFELLVFDLTLCTV